MTFEILGIKKIISDKLKKMGIKIPTEIQEEVIPKVFFKKDVIAQSKTGSGKTLAFLLPLLERVYKSASEKILILTPTRELALQISEVLKTIDVEDKVESVLMYGGRELSNNYKVESSVNFIIATPGRLIDCMNKNMINLSQIKTLIIDEADQMIELGFKNEMEEIVKKCPKKRETLLFSATLSSEIKKIAYRFTVEPEVVVIEDKEDSLSKINQKYVETTDRRKIDILCQMINEDNPFMGIIFCRTKARVDRLDELLTERGFSCQKLHSDIPQAKREKIIKSFKNLEVQFLIATDIVSRGIDVSGVTHVYNYDAPENSEIYIHRIGRTGRAGKSGESNLILTERDSHMLKEIETELNTSLEMRDVLYTPDVANLNQLPERKYDKKITISSKKIENIKIIKNRARIKKDFKEGR